MSFWSRKGVCSNKEQTNRQQVFTVQRGLLALAALCSVGVVVRAQDLPPGLIARLDITQRLEYSDNPDLDENGSSDFSGRTVLNFGLESVTTLERFTFNIGTDIEEFAQDNDDDLDPTNTFVTLGYTRENRNALLGIDLRYRESDVDSSFFNEDFDQNSNIITQDDGKRVSYGYGLRWAIGREAPIGASLNWTYNQIEFVDTSDTDLDDSTLNDLSGQVDFRITPTVTASLTGKYIDFDTDDGVDRETNGLGIATSLEVSPIVTANVGLSYDRIERSGDETGTDEGVSGNFGVQRVMPSGALGLSYVSSVSSNDDGRRSTLTVSRDWELPQGALSLSLGVTGADTIGSDPLIQANYRHNLRSAQINFGLSQSVVTDDDNNEDINTSLQASYDQQINSLSSLGLSMSFFNREELDTTGNDSQRINLGLNYRYNLTRDWGLVSGISHTLVTEDGSADRDRTTVFLGLERSFNWNP